VLFDIGLGGVGPPDNLGSDRNAIRDVTNLHQRTVFGLDGARLDQRTELSNIARPVPEKEGFGHTGSKLDARGNFAHKA
jgi:hypothetical protein